MKRKSPKNAQRKSATTPTAIPAFAPVESPGDGLLTDTEVLVPFNDDCELVGVFPVFVMDGVVG